MSIYIFKCKPFLTDSLGKALEKDQIWLGWNRRGLFKLAHARLPFDKLRSQLRQKGYGWSAVESIGRFISPEMTKGVDLIVVPRRLGRQGFVYYLARLESDPKPTTLSRAGRTHRLLGRDVTWLNGKAHWPGDSAPLDIQEKFRRQFTCRRLDDSPETDRWLRKLLKDDAAALDTQEDAAMEEQERASGQGQVTDPRARKAIERQAMAKARSYLTKNQYREIEDTSKRKSYDFECRKGGKTFYIEVKGTQGKGERVILTAREREHIKNHPAQSFLLCVSLIDVQKPQLQARGGVTTPYNASRILRGNRWRPTQWELTLP